MTHGDLARLWQRNRWHRSSLPDFLVLCDPVARNVLSTLHILSHLLLTTVWHRHHLPLCSWRHWSIESSYQPNVTLPVRDRTGVRTQVVWPCIPFSRIIWLYDFSVQGKRLGGLSCEGNQWRDQSDGLDFGGCHMMLGGSGGSSMEELESQAQELGCGERKRRFVFCIPDGEQFHTVHCINSKDFKGSSLVDWTLCTYEKRVKQKQNWTLYASSELLLGKHVAESGNVFSCPFFPSTCLEDKQGRRYEFEVSPIFEGWNHKM